MDLKARDFIKAIQEAQHPTEVIRLWTEAAKGSNLSIKDIVEIHQACGNILVEAVHSGIEEEVTKEETEK